LINEAGPYEDPNVIPGVADQSTTTTPAPAPAPATPAPVIPFGDVKVCKTKTLSDVAKEMKVSHPDIQKKWIAAKCMGKPNCKQGDYQTNIDLRNALCEGSFSATGGVVLPDTLKPKEVASLPTSNTVTTVNTPTIGGGGALPDKLQSLPTSSGNKEIDTWLQTDMGKAFSKLTDPNQKENMFDYLEKNDPTISKLGRDVAGPILLGAINADTKLGRFGQKVGQGVNAFRNVFKK
jgi:hypothetical protein